MEDPVEPSSSNKLRHSRQDPGGRDSICRVHVRTRLSQPAEQFIDDIPRMLAEDPLIETKLNVDPESGKTISLWISDEEGWTIALPGEWIIDFTGDYRVCPEQDFIDYWEMISW